MKDTNTKKRLQITKEKTDKKEKKKKHFASEENV
jgi:hypothetical protein